MLRYSWVFSISGFQQTSKNGAPSPVFICAVIRTALGTDPKRTLSFFGLRSRIRVSNGLMTI